MRKGTDSKGALYDGQGFKAYVSENILNWHSLSLSLSADLYIHFYCLSRLRQASQ